MSRAESVSESERESAKERESAGERERVSESESQRENERAPTLGRSVVRHMDREDWWLDLKQGERVFTVQRRMAGSVHHATLRSRVCIESNKEEEKERASFDAREDCQTSTLVDLHF